jgi:hypothetical protein
VPVRLSSVTAVAAIGESSSLLERRHFGVGHHRRRVDDAELRPPGHRPAAAFLLHIDGDVHGGDVVGVVARFDHGVSAVEFDEQIVIVAAEQEIDRAGREDRVILLTAGMDDRYDEVSAFAA